MKRLTTAYLLSALIVGVFLYGQDTITYLRRTAGGPSLPQSGSILAHYDFSDGSGTTLSDVSGNNYDGTITSATWATCDTTENCLTFDNTDDEVTLPQGLLDDLESESSWTVIIWAEHSTYASTADVAFAVGAGTTDERFILPFDTFNGDGLRITGNAHHVDQNTGTLDDSALHMFTYVQDAADSHEGFEDDATSVGTGSTSNALPATLDCGHIGRRCHSSGGWFVGNISRVVIWSVALNSTEVGDAFDVGP